jgi:hypothetical protein
MTNLFDIIKHGAFRLIALLIWVMLFALMAFEILLMIAANGLHYIKSRLQPKRKRVKQPVEPEQPYMRYVTRQRN